MSEKKWTFSKNPDTEIVKVEVKYYPTKFVNYFVVTQANGERYYTDYGEVRDFIETAGSVEHIDHPNGSHTTVYTK